jgi:RNA polymerase-binding transcription factor DksA
MIIDDQINVLREKLLARRGEILDFRQGIQGTWENLHEPEVELEESAQKVSLSQALGQLDSSERDEIEAIDRALQRMQIGEYGRCESCGRMINPKRLQALPATAVCKRCAQKREGGLDSEGFDEDEPERDADLPPEFQGFSDEELEKAVYEELKNDGRVDLEELQIECENGIVRLKGAVPSEEEHHILVQIVEDVMDLRNAEDHVVIDRALRSKQADPSGKTEDEVLFEGEDLNEDAFESRKTGIPFSPADAFVPDGQKRKNR